MMLIAPFVSPNGHVVTWLYVRQGYPPGGRNLCNRSPNQTGKYRASGEVNCPVCIARYVHYSMCHGGYPCTDPAGWNPYTGKPWYSSLNHDDTPAIGRP